MNSRTIRGSSDTISLFPFLAVLLSTMGALLVLLVVLAQKAKQQAFEQVVSQAHTTAQGLPLVDRAAAREAQQLQQQLEQLHHDQQQLAKVREQAVARQRDEQLRLSHLEEHSRRLEHDLAKLQLAAQQLQATEKKQVVDQEQAERELARLQELIEEYRLEVDSLREQSVGKRSYAIIPYRGPQGTVRRPIYLECTKDGVVIQPEGIRLTARDFLTRFDSGNPLAKALRAARDLLNTRAAKAGESEPPDPYPLLVVRPDGIQQYLAARAAIKSWDADFGYEFIDQQWSLQYPESDPELAQVMRHAVMQGRERTVMLIRNAPRRYGRLGNTVSLNRGRSNGGDSANQFTGGSSQGYGWGTDEGQTGSLSTGNNRGSASGNQANGFAESSIGTGKLTGSSAATDRFESTVPVNNDSGGRGTDGVGGQNDPYLAAAETQTTDHLAHASSAGWEKNGELIEPGSDAASPSSNSQYASPNRASQFAASHASGVDSKSAGSPPAGTGGSASGADASGKSQGSSSGAATAQSSGAVHFSSGTPESMANTRGSNWATPGAQRGSVPIRRPIHVVIRKDRIAILQSRHTSKDSPYPGTVIPLNQSTEQVMDEFASALREHMKDWGMAGNGLYWRPVLQLNIGPQGQQQAARFTRLLKDSGVEVAAPRTARQNQEVPAHVTR